MPGMKKHIFYSRNYENHCHTFREYIKLTNEVRDYWDAVGQIKKKVKLMEFPTIIIKEVRENVKNLKNKKNTCLRQN